MLTRVAIDLYKAAQGMGSAPSPASSTAMSPSNPLGTMGQNAMGAGNPLSRASKPKTQMGSGAAGAANPLARPPIPGAAGAGSMNATNPLG